MNTPTICSDRVPSQEDIYALFRMGAEKIGCNTSSAIYQINKLSFNELRKRGVKRRLKSGIRVIESEDFNAFWSILNENLTRKYAKTAVHSTSDLIFQKEGFGARGVVYDTYRLEIVLYIPLHTKTEL